MVVPMVEGHSSLHITLLGAQAMFTVVVQAQYNVYYGYTAQELQEFIADTETGMVVEEMVYDGADCHCRVPDTLPSSSSSSSSVDTTTTTTTTTTTEYSSPSSSSSSSSSSS